MPRKRSSAPKELSHRWYLAEWATHHGKKQADAQRELGWAKSTASELWNGQQRYTQHLVDEVARWFGIQPYEVLLPPEEAIALRNIRQSAEVIAYESRDRRQTGGPAA